LRNKKSISNYSYYSAVARRLGITGNEKSNSKEWLHGFVPSTSSSLFREINDIDLKPVHRKRFSKVMAIEETSPMRIEDVETESESESEDIIENNGNNSSEYIYHFTLTLTPNDKGSYDTTFVPSLTNNDSLEDEDNLESEPTSISKNSSEMSYDLSVPPSFENEESELDEYRKERPHYPRGTFVRFTFSLSSNTYYSGIGKILGDGSKPYHYNIKQVLKPDIQPGVDADDSDFDINDETIEWKQVSACYPCIDTLNISEITWEELERIKQQVMELEVKDY
jgi:hypothetical protein